MAKEQISMDLVIPVIDDLRKYLRLATIHGRVAKHTCQSISDKVNKRLVGWKSKTLSMAGRATLIQSTIAGIPSYAMQMVVLPGTLCDELDRKVRRFL